MVSINGISVLVVEKIIAANARINIKSKIHYQPKGKPE